MPQSNAVIRLYEPKDKKLVQFMVGKANLQALAVANNKVYLHPLTIAIWLGLASVMIQYMNWWPAGKHGWMEYLKPLPALASVAVPLMFFVDWINRPQFEELTQQVMRYEDLHDITSYYSKQSSSGFWILELGDVFVGLIAVDASQSFDQSSSGTSAAIRHFHVEEAYRTTKIQNDLLKHAVNQAFDGNPKLNRIEALDSPFTPYIQQCLRESGFQFARYIKEVGLLKWKLSIRYLERDAWLKRTA
ncbi:hypothetical protein D9613_001853 [Agrocybe pediades]|uniref:N-acetyltransferase domain-containing protein n=1 Tax=Agrocybe pediades TaxID=84607 RepID=A0A8H4VXE8_9AGAR|nr:hypothetical protein D9613_001853 [Agrocybe pediades]KAF9569621.1 hypothetical protein CPC08DRAFT_677180 [Agrocybe pediades]